MAVTVTKTTLNGITSHTIDMKGTVGALFGTLMAAILLNVIGTATANWSVGPAGQGGYSAIGLWVSCQCQQNNDMPPWFRAVQAMINIGLIFLIIAILLLTLYVGIAFIPRKCTLICFTALAIGAFLFTMIGVAVYGTRANREGFPPNYSFAFAVLATVLSLLAGLLSIAQMRRSGVIGHKRLEEEGS